MGTRIESAVIQYTFPESVEEAKLGNLLFPLFAKADEMAQGALAKVKTTLKGRKFSFLVGKEEGGRTFVLPYSSRKEELHEELKGPQKFAAGSYSDIHSVPVYVKCQDKISVHVSALSKPILLKPEEAKEMQELYFNGYEILLKAQGPHVEPAGVLYVKGEKVVRVRELFEKALWEMTSTSAISSTQCKAALQHILNGVTRLVSLGIYPFDLKSLNVLLKNDEFHLCDLMDATVLNGSHQEMIRLNRWKKGEDTFVMHAPFYSSLSFLKFTRDLMEYKEVLFSGYNDLWRLQHLKESGEKELVHQIGRCAVELFAPDLFTSAFNESKIEEFSYYTLKLEFYPVILGRYLRQGLTLGQAQLLLNALNPSPHLRPPLPALVRGGRGFF